MNDEFQGMLEQMQPTAEMVEVAAKIFIMEQTEYEPDAALRNRLAKTVSDVPAFEKALRELERDPQTRSDACLTFLSFAWQEPSNRQSIRAAFHAVKSTLPVVEAGLLALIAMYGMYLLITRGKSKTVRVMRTLPDGTREESEEVQYHSPVGPLSVVGKLWKGGPAS